MKLPFGLGGSRKVEKRESIGQWPAMPLGSLNLGGGRSYQEVDAVSGENSLQSVAFRSAADLMASLVSELPFNVFSGTGSDKRKRNTPGYLEDPSGDGHGVEDWMYQLMMSWILRGNAYGDILDQGPTGMLRQVDLFHPDSVSVTLDNGKPHWMVRGRTVEARDMYHKRVNPIAGHLLGLSVVHSHADSLGLSIATTRFGQSWFQDGGHPGGVLSNSEADMSDPKVLQTAKDRFVAALFGSREPLVLGRGWKYDQIQVAPEESQFLETSGWSEAQCARILGAGVAEVLGYATGGSMTYATVVDRDLALLKYAANRWLRRMDRVLSQFLPRPQYAKMDRDAFLESNALQRWQTYAIKLDKGAATINEVRDKEDEKPVAWGSEPFKLAPAAAPAAEPDDTDPNEDPNPTDPPTQA